MGADGSTENVYTQPPIKQTHVHTTAREQARILAMHAARRADEDAVPEPPSPFVLRLSGYLTSLSKFPDDLIPENGLNGNWFADIVLNWRIQNVVKYPTEPKHGSSRLAEVKTIRMSPW
jgi:hypothetical protein